jgi:hypothetical protein
MTHLRTVSSVQHASCWYSLHTVTSPGMNVGVDTCFFTEEKKKNPRFGQ